MTIRFNSVRLKLDGGYYVYHHLVNGRVVYIGKGCRGRGFDIGYGGYRGKRWTDAVGDARELEVQIVSYHANQLDAFKEESAQIVKLRPPGNTVGNPGVRDAAIKAGMEAWRLSQPLSRQHLFEPFDPLEDDPLRVRRLLMEYAN